MAGPVTKVVRSTRANPWRLFPYSRPEAAMRWAAVGNVAILWNAPTERRTGRGLRHATLWAQTEPLLREALASLGCYPRDVHTDPHPWCDLYGNPLHKAVLKCSRQHIDTSPSA